MTSINIQLLGGARFLSENGSELSFSTKKAKALLIYFAANTGRRFTRESLCELLWSRSALEQAKGSLRQALSQLRRLLHGTDLADALHDEQGLGLTLPQDRLDTAQFKELCRATGLISWQTASELYTDEFIAGFHIKEAGFENWVSAQRTSYYDQALAVQKKIIPALIEQNRAEDTISACQHLLSLDPLDEWGVCALMQAFTALSRRAEAIKLYQAYTTKLQQDLDAAPGRTAQELFIQLKQSNQGLPSLPTFPNLTPPPATLTSQSQTPNSLPTTTRDSRPIIGVLPFENHSTDEKDAYLADGLTEDIIIGLNRSPVLRVLDRNQTFGSKDLTEESGATIKTDVDYIFRGSVSTENNNIRIRAKLVERKDNSICWAKSYERPFTDIFDVQREITAAIVSVLEPVVMDKEQQIALLMEDSAEHWHLLMKGRWHFWRTSPKDNRKAQELLNKALYLKPNDATTLLTLAFTHMAQAWVFCDQETEKSVAAAMHFAQASVRADYTDPWAHLAMGTAYSCRGDLQRALAEHRHALELNPYFATARGELARLYAFTGTESKKAFAYANQALEESPADPHANLWRMSIGMAHFIIGNKEEALTAAIDAATQRPNWFQNHLLLCVCQYESGNLDAARNALFAGLNLTPNYTVAAFDAGHPFQRAIDRDRFVGILRKCGWQT